MAIYMNDQAVSAYEQYQRAEAEAEERAVEFKAHLEGINAPYCVECNTRMEPTDLVDGWCEGCKFFSDPANEAMAEWDGEF